MKTSLTPQNIPLVGISFMNITHQEEVELVNKLMEKIEKRLLGDDIDFEISQLMTTWLEHTQSHFARENELMLQTGFPAFPVHSEEHEIALKRMQTVVDAWQQNKDIELLKDYVFTLWPNWFKAHVTSMDKVTAEFALTHGFKES